MLMLPKGKFDGVDTAPMFDLKPSEAGSPPPPPPPPYGRGERTYARVWCPLGHHVVRVIDDGVHLRYATHWPTKGGQTVMCLTSEQCTARVLPAAQREPLRRTPTEHRFPRGVLVRRRWARR